MGIKDQPGQTAARLNAKAKREKSVKLRVLGKTWQQIADEVGYSHPAAAHRAVQEYFRAYPSPDAEELRAVENMKLDELEQHVIGYLHSEHVVVSASGKVATRFAGWMTDPETGLVMTDDKGKMVPRLEEVIDHEPILRAVKALLDIAARRAKLNGLDQQSVKIEFDDGSVDKEIEDLVAQFGGPVEIPQGSNEKPGKGVSVDAALAALDEEDVDA